MDGDVKAALGRRVREIRKSRGLTLEDLGHKVGLAPSTLSKIENGSLSVTYDALVALSSALSVGVTDLFADSREPAPMARRVVTRAGGGDVYDTDVYRYEMLCSDLAKKKMIPIHARIKARSIGLFPRLITHAGEEFVYVLDGAIELHTEHYQPLRLITGDSAYFDSRMGHALVSSGDADAEILWVCTDLDGDTPLSDRRGIANGPNTGSSAPSRVRQKMS